MDLLVTQFGTEQTKPSHRYGPHVRDHYLIHYVLHGKGILYAHGRTHCVGQGQAFVIYPDQVTVYQADERDPWHYGWVGFVGGDAAALVAATGATDAEPVVQCPYNLISVIHQMQQDVRLSDSGLALTGGLMRFLALLGDNKRENKSAARGLYEKALWYLRSNYQRSITIAETARFVGLSRSQLFRVFHSESGLSPKQALTGFRLEEACRLLANTGLTVQEVSYAVGIPSPSRFCALFSAEFGVSPGQYAKSAAHGGASAL